MNEKYTFDLEFSRIKQKLILVKSDLELRNHVVLKLMAYLLFYDPRLKIEVDVERHYRPDLVIPGDHGVPELWIDCGKVAVRKVSHLTAKLKTTRIIIVKETLGELNQFRRLVGKKIDHPERLEYLAFEPYFVTSVAGILAKINEVTLYDVMENVIGLAMNGEIFETTLYR